MAGLKRFRYTDKDHDAIVNDCIARIKQAYGVEYWNDFEEDNTGRMLVEAYAYVTDLLLFYLDRQANETYLPTATERQNIINMCKLVGYSPKGSKSAQALIKVSIENVHDKDITLPAGSQCMTNSGLIFETQSDAVINAGELSASVIAIEGETFNEVIGISDGDINQEFFLQRSGVVEIQSVNIDGVAWEYVESFANQQPEAQVYTAEIDAWKRGIVSFGNGVTGQIPEQGAVIRAVYRIGGGTSGNVAPNMIINVRNIAQDEDGHNIPVKITNEDWASGGAEPESIESIKLWAPRYFETQDRCVTQFDYEAFAMKFDGIAKARAVVRERSGEANIIRLYVLTYGEREGTITTSNQAVKEKLLDYMNKYKMLTDWLEIEDGICRAIDFAGSIVVSDGFSMDKVLTEIKSALSELMNIETREMGEALRISDVYAAIDNIEGVLYVELDTPSQTVEAENSELLTLGNIRFKLEYKE